jgi:hypothetical protein
MLANAIPCSATATAVLSNERALSDDASLLWLLLEEGAISSLLHDANTTAMNKLANANLIIPIDMLACILILVFMTFVFVLFVINK